MTRTKTLTSLAILAVAISGAVAGPHFEAQATVPPSPSTYSYRVLSTQSGYCGSGSLGAIKNATGRSGSYSLASATGRSVTISGSVSYSVGSPNTMSATVGYSITASRTFTVSGTHTLKPGETLYGTRMYTRRQVRETRRVRSTGATSTKTGYAYQPTGVCAKIR